MKNTNVAISVVSTGSTRAKINQSLRKRLGDEAQLYEEARSLTILHLPRYGTQEASNLLLSREALNEYFGIFPCTKFKNLCLEDFLTNFKGRPRLFRNQQAHIYEHVVVPLALDLVEEKVVAADVVWLFSTKRHKHYGIVISTEFPQREFKILTMMVWVWLGDALLWGAPFPTIKQARSALKELYRRPSLIQGGKK